MEEEVGTEKEEIEEEEVDDGDEEGSEEEDDPVSSMNPNQFSNHVERILLEPHLC
jgi:hypothetical protein